MTTIHAPDPTNVIDRYLLIVGAPKAATTSMFRYLADHPEVCGASRKETYFFARDFDDQHVACPGTSLTDFEQYFQHATASGQLRVEASPYTMYTRGSAEAIAATLPDVTVLAIVRDPVERLVSDFRFRQQRAGSAGIDLSFEDHCAEMLAHPEPTDPLAIGQYVDFLEPFRRKLGAGRVLVRFSQELAEDPVGQMQLTSIDMGIDPSFFETYDFGTHNRTIAVRSRRLQDVRLALEPHVRRTRQLTARYPRLHKVSSAVFSAGGAAIDRVNERATAEYDEIPADARERVRAHYEPYDARLADFAGRELPWR